MVRPIFCCPDNFQTLSVSVVYCCDHPLSVNTRNGCPRLGGNEISCFFVTLPSIHSHSVSLPVHRLVPYVDIKDIT